MAIRGIVAVQGYIYPLFIYIWVELYLTQYLNYLYRSGLVHWANISSIDLSTNSYIVIAWHQIITQTQISGGEIDGFLSLQPFFHLDLIVILVTHIVPFLHVVNMESFQSFRIQAINAPEVLDRQNIVSHGVQFQDVEVFMDAQNAKGIFVGMEFVKCMLHFI